MKYIKLIILTIFLFGYTNLYSAEEVYFVNIQKILNESKAGKGAQDVLKKDFASTNKKFADESNSLKKEETELIAQKKSLSPEEYKKKVSAWGRDWIRICLNNIE